MAGPLVAGSGGNIRRVIADGAYDGAPVTKAIRAARPARSPPRIVVPPPARSIPPPGQAHGGSERERHCAEIADARSHEMATGARLRTEITGRNRHRSAERPHRRNPARPHVRRPAKGGRDRHLGPEPTDPSGETCDNQGEMRSPGRGDHNLLVRCTKAMGNRVTNPDGTKVNNRVDSARTKFTQENPTGASLARD